MSAHKSTVTTEFDTQDLPIKAVTATCRLTGKGRFRVEPATLSPGVLFIMCEEEDHREYLVSVDMDAAHQIVEKLKKIIKQQGG